MAGVRRATVSDSAPSDFLTPAQISKCVACHTMSRNGTRIAADIGGNVLGVYNVRIRVLSSIQPEHRDGLDHFQSRHHTHCDREQRNPSRCETETPNFAWQHHAAGQQIRHHAGLVPDGSKLVFTYSAVNKDRGVSGSSIATMDYNGTGFANLKVLVQSTGNSDSKYYPSFSRIRSGLPTSPLQEELGQQRCSQALHHFNQTVRWGPIDLGKANTIVNNQIRTLTGAAARLADTMPTWLPPSPAGTMFIAFYHRPRVCTVYAAESTSRCGWLALIHRAVRRSG